MCCGGYLVKIGPRYDITVTTVSVIVQLVLLQPEHTSEMELWELVLELLTRPPPRGLLPSVTTLSDVVQLIKNSNNIIVLSGAGVRINSSPS